MTSATSSAFRPLSVCVRRHRASIDRATRPLRLADGSTVGVARFGQGPTVLCVPTIAELNFVYAPQVEALSDRFDVVLYRPRLSRTSRVLLADRVRELNLVVDALRVPTVHLLAWSDAGSVAYLAARQRRFASAVFVGLPDRYRFPGPLQAFADALYSYPLERAVPATAIALLLSHFLGGRRIPPHWVFAEARRLALLPAFFKHSILPCMWEHRPVPGEVALPSLLLGGTRDALVTVDSMRAMARLLGGQCEFVIVPDGEHMLTYANPDPVNRALARFYQRLTGPAAVSATDHSAQSTIGPGSQDLMPS